MTLVPRQENTVARVTVETLFKGLVDVDEGQIVEFVGPLLGYDSVRRCIIYQTQEGPLYWLQAVDDPQACFCVLAPFEAGLDPDFDIGPEDAADIAASGADDILVYTVVVLDEDSAKIRTNLRAPILIGRSSLKAKQVVLNDPRLPIQHFLASGGVPPTGPSAGS